MAHNTRWTGWIVVCALAVWSSAVIGVSAYAVLLIRPGVQDAARWSALGDALQGIGTLALAVQTVVAGAWAIWLYFRQRAHELAVQTRQNVIDLVHLVGEKIRAQTLLADKSAGDEQRVHLSDLQETARLYRVLLDGLIRSLPEAQERERQALLAVLDSLLGGDRSPAAGEEVSRDAR